MPTRGTRRRATSRRTSQKKPWRDATFYKPIAYVPRTRIRTARRK